MDRLLAATVERKYKEMEARKMGGGTPGELGLRMCHIVNTCGHCLVRPP